MLELRNVTKAVGASDHIRDVSMTLERGSLNVLLGPTLAGKTTLMRLMAGLDVPTNGSILMDGKDVRGVRVQDRNVAMVYQQFINYPALTVYENIASPLRVKRTDQATIDREVRSAAELMRLTSYLDRLPLNLSGGQQQRTALARAIVKNAGLVLLDEPLANLDYKLREELREELPKIFAQSGAIFVYATTEPHEALLLGGNTAILDEGRLVQFGPTIEVFRRPTDLLSARTFADPPLNTLKVVKQHGHFVLHDALSIPVPQPISGIADGPYTIAIKPHHLTTRPVGPDSVPVRARVTVTEITGSESFVHIAFADAAWIMLAAGVLAYEPDAPIEVYVDPRHLLVFDAEDRAVAASLAMAA